MSIFSGGRCKKSPAFIIFAFIINHNNLYPMYRFLSLLTSVSLLPLLYSCGDDKVNDPSEDDVPILISSVPSDGAVDVPISTNTIVLSFDRDVNVYNGFSFDGTSLSLLDITKNKSQLTIKLPSALSQQSTYTLNVAAGAVASSNSVPMPAFSISFTTEKVVPPSVSSTLATPSPMASTQKVFDYLVSQYGSSVLSSTMANVNWNFDEAKMVYNLTGKYPAIATMDYIHAYTPTSDNTGWKVDYDNLTEVQKWWNEGGILSASWHWMIPVSEAKIGTSDVTYEPSSNFAKNALIEGTWQNKQMKADLDMMASHLLKLQNAGIPLIWRPLHEAAGNTYEYNNGKAWFWWGYDGADVFKQLWHYMFDFFKQKGINNLIWVWTSCNNKDWAYYPGDEYVDIIGIDIYNNKDAQSIAELFSGLKSHSNGKMVTLSECGGVAKLSAQWSAGAQWSYFMPWYDYDADNTSKSLDNHLHANSDWWKDAMNMSNIITRDQLPSFK